MYIYENTYSSLTNFINGYLMALKDMSGCNLYSDTHAWLEKKVKRSFAICWEGYILDYMAKKDEAVATKKLFELLEEFIATKKEELQRESSPSSTDPKKEE